AVPGDVDCRAGALRELGGADERGHPVRLEELARVEEETDELRLERHDLLLHVRDVRVRDAGLNADLRVLVLVELHAVALEARDEHLRGRDLEIGRLGTGRRGRRAGKRNGGDRNRPRQEAHAPPRYLRSPRFLPPPRCDGRTLLRFADGASRSTLAEWPTFTSAPAA